MNLLVTGGAGFIGSCFVRLLLAENPNLSIITLDLLTYCSSEASLAEVKGNPRHRFVRGDICDAPLVSRLLAEHSVDMIINFAAESHVDRSITAAQEFIRTNVTGVQVLLDCARAHGLKKFVQISTDEVYGSLGDHGVFNEDSPLHPSSPYSASKAAADLLCLAYSKTYALPVVITRSTNAYGPFQYPEKLIPVLIEKAFADQPLPLYGNGQNVRTWIYVEDNCRAIREAALRGEPGMIYNVTSNEERSNLAVAQFVLKHLKKPASLLSYVADRPGHDWRYALDGSRLSHTLGWSPQVKFEEGLQTTIDWYAANRPWVAAIKAKN